mmetsp:Transcript_10083/g.41824  ORF Transcript_10083/g.41824 Transcript_10083/m.41824 type:complete len:237 (-) Transcript_10083:270-980(-)
MRSVSSRRGAPTYSGASKRLALACASSAASLLRKRSRHHSLSSCSPSGSSLASMRRTCTWISAGRLQNSPNRLGAGLPSAGMNVTSYTASTDCARLDATATKPRVLGTSVCLGTGMPLDFANSCAILSLLCVKRVPSANSTSMYGSGLALMFAKLRSMRSLSFIQLRVMKTYPDSHQSVPSTGTKSALRFMIALYDPSAPTRMPTAQPVSQSMSLRWLHIMMPLSRPTASHAAVSP